MSNDLIYKSAKELLGLFERKEASPVEAIKAVLERVEERRISTHSFLWMKSPLWLRRRIRKRDEVMEIQKAF